MDRAGQRRAVDKIAVDVDGSVGETYGLRERQGSLGFTVRWRSENREQRLVRDDSLEELVPQKVSDVPNKNKTNDNAELAITELSLLSSYGKRQCTFPETAAIQSKTVGLVFRRYLQDITRDEEEGSDRI